MTDCTGYGFGARVTLCVDGPIDEDTTANLTIIMDDFGNHENFQCCGDNEVVVPNWDGSAIRVNVTPTLLPDAFSAFAAANCDLELFLTIIPQEGTRGRTKLDWVFSECAPLPAPNNDIPDVFVECGGPGPHVVSEIGTFDLIGPACAVM